MDRDRLQHLEDRADVVDVVNGVARNADLRDWDAVGRAFAPEVELDSRIS